MIYTGENKSILCKGDFRPAELYKGDKKIAGYKLTEFEGIGSVTLENCYNDKVYNACADEGVQSITVRGKNYFDLDKIPFNTSTTQPYNNGLKAMKTGSSSTNSPRIPIYLPADKTIYMTMKVVDFQINGTSKNVIMRFYNSENTVVRSMNISATIGKKAYSFTLSEDILNIRFFFQANDASNAVGDYVTMDNIMLRCEGDDTYESYIEPQTVQFENGAPAKDIPTFKGTTIIEIDTSVTASISGKYKKMEG